MIGQTLAGSARRGRRLTLMRALQGGGVAGMKGYFYRGQGQLQCGVMGEQQEWSQGPEVR